MLATMPVRTRPRMLTFPVKGHFLSMYDPSMACKDIITCWACCVYLWRVHPFIWTKLSSQDMDEKQNPRFNLAHKKAHVWGIWTMSWRHETRKWACFNLCKFLIPPWNCGKNKPIIIFHQKYEVCQLRFLRKIFNLSMITSRRKVSCWVLPKKNCASSCVARKYTWF